MKVGFVFILLVLMLLNGSNSIDVSSIDCGNACSAKNGTSYTLTCKWSGTLGAGIIWRRKGIEVLSCNLAGTCVPNGVSATGSYVTSQLAEMRITNFSNADIGQWECSDDPGTRQSCTLTPIAPRNIILEALCGIYIVTCKLNDHGSPAITLEMRDDNVIDSTTTAGQFTKTISGAGMKTYTCAVTGQESECATPKLKTTRCYGSGPPIAALVVNLILVAIVIVLLVLIKWGVIPKIKAPLYVFMAMVIIIAVVFIILLFVLYTDRTEALFIVAVVIVFAGLIVGIVAVIILKFCLYL